MKKIFFYAIIFILMFINGLDSVLLYKRTFLEGQVYLNSEYIHFYFSILATILIGYIFTKKLVEKYDFFYIFRVSLLLSSVVLWTQYKVLHHSQDYLVSQIIFDNIKVAVVLGFFSYALIKLNNLKEDFNRKRRQTIVSVIIAFLGFFYAYLINYSNLQSAFLISSITYFIGYISICCINMEEIISEDDKIKNKSLLFSLIYILLAALVIHYNWIMSLKFLSEDVYPLYVFLLCMFFEGLKAKSNESIKRNTRNF